MLERPPHGLPAAQGLNSQTFTAVSSSKTSRLCPSLCALQPTPQPVSAVAGLSWCASSQPRRLGARALFHAVHARASCCPLVSDAQSMFWRDVKAKCLADKKKSNKPFSFMGLLVKLLPMIHAGLVVKCFFLDKLV